MFRNRMCVRKNEKPALCYALFPLHYLPAIVWLSDHSSAPYCRWRLPCKLKPQLHVQTLHKLLNALGISTQLRNFCSSPRLSITTDIKSYYVMSVSITITILCNTITIFGIHLIFLHTSLVIFTGNFPHLIFDSHGLVAIFNCDPGVNVKVTLSRPDEFNHAEVTVL